MVKKQQPLNQKLEDFGICSKTGKVFNPFGQKPAWAIKKSEVLLKNNTLTKSEEAMF